ncbi:MAG: EutN/CcmL family microcompartment protein [Blastocatellia bacterium]|nr:EutN/CcmL family microcompartment protein [Blastocatellia bacterium]MCS7157782.1 EutN/CcmL family microcompartment protein [Blastocatellia bacterium]MCX7753295.1 EutN/CcmL family microcompartment protein [Blastocatellia bacterium]MDW8257610.1 EutN/CcmL family microcompartment protein [Acidobacteriota bacterium]
MAQVIGRVVYTAKDETPHELKLLVISPSLSPDREPAGNPLIATDPVGAGASEFVLWCRGRGMSFPIFPREVPADCPIVGIVDDIATSLHRPARDHFRLDRPSSGEKSLDFLALLL